MPTPTLPAGRGLGDYGFADIQRIFPEFSEGSDRTEALNFAAEIFRRGGTAYLAPGQWRYTPPLILKATRFTGNNGGALLGGGFSSTFLCPNRNDLPAVYLQGETLSGGRREWYGRIASLGIRHDQNPASPAIMDTASELVNHMGSLAWPGEHLTYDSWRFPAGCGIAWQPELLISSGGFTDLWLLTAGPCIWGPHNSFSYSLSNVHVWSVYGPGIAIGGGICTELRTCYLRRCGAGCAGLEVVDFVNAYGLNGMDGSGSGSTWMMAGAVLPTTLTLGTNAGASTVTLPSQPFDDMRNLAVTPQTGPAAGITRRIVSHSGAVCTLNRAWPSPPVTGNSVFVHSEIAKYNPPGGLTYSSWHSSAQVHLYGINIEDVAVGIISHRLSDFDIRNMRVFANTVTMTALMQIAASSKLSMGGTLRLDGSVPDPAVKATGSISARVELAPAELDQYFRQDTSAAVAITST